MCCAMAHAVVLVTDKSQSEILNSGTILEKYRGFINLAIVATFTLSFGGDAHTENLLFKIDAYCVVQISWERLGRKQRDGGLETG